MLLVEGGLSQSYSAFRLLVYGLIKYKYSCEIRDVHAEYSEIIFGIIGISKHKEQFWNNWAIPGIKMVNILGK